MAPKKYYEFDKKVIAYIDKIQQLLDIGFMIEITVKYPNAFIQFNLEAIRYYNLDIDLQGEPGRFTIDEYCTIGYEEEEVSIYSKDEKCRMQFYKRRPGESRELIPEYE